MTEKQKESKPGRLATGLAVGSSTAVLTTSGLVTAGLAVDNDLQLADLLYSSAIILAFTTIFMLAIWLTYPAVKYWMIRKERRD